MGLSARTRGPAFAGLLLALPPTAVWALDLPPTHAFRPVLIPGHYACMEGSTPTSEFDILDGTGYFLRGTMLRAGDFAYDKPTSTIAWTTGPFAGIKMIGYNTTRLTDKKPVIVLRFEPAGEPASTEYCTIVD